MSDINSVTTKHQFVVIRKSVVPKPSRYRNNDYAKSSTANSYLPSVKHTTCQQSVTEAICQPVISSSEGSLS